MQFLRYRALMELVSKMPSHGSQIISRNELKFILIYNIILFLLFLLFISTNKQNAEVKS